MSEPLINKLCEHWREKFPDAAIRKAVYSAFPELNMIEPPVDVNSLAYKRGVIRIRTSNMQADGTISLVDSNERKYIIDLNTNHSETRKRFTCAHEIGHTFFFDLDDEIHTKSRLLIEDGDLTRGPNKQEEYLCNVAAAEILMPYRVFSAKVYGTPPTVNSLVALSQLFKTSIRATARRMVQMYSRHINLVIGLWEYQPNLDCYQTSWIIRSIKNRNREKLTVDKTAPMFRTFHTMSSFRGRKLISLGGHLDDYFVDASVLKSSDPRSVLTVFILDSRADSLFETVNESPLGIEQLNLFK